LSGSLKLPLISKDTFKERIFDTLGYSDKAWSLKASAAAHRLMDYVIEEELKAGRSLIVESNFRIDRDSQRFTKIQAKYGCKLIQVLCWAQGSVLYERFMHRQQTSRHAGYVESASPEQIRKDLAPGKCDPLNIPGKTIEIDTTDFNRVDYKEIIKHIQSLIT
jgi:hypothetical protein